MSKIHLLDEELINKIAAGEVIERPASVVKELVENALDAGATRIVVEIIDSGKTLIKVADNGEGMSPEDARKSIVRHATSKLASADDLFAINTLGFRGEALASIAAISHLLLVTKQRDVTAGYSLAAEAGAIVRETPVGAAIGTTIEVRNIFFNTPARKKFLKTDAVELGHIIDVVTMYALANPAISFQLLHEGHVLLNSPSVEEQRNNIASIYGAGLAKDLLEINYQDDHLSISGYVAKPYQARNDKHQQALFVNGRWVKSKEITKAVYDGFHSLLFVNKHPIFVFYITLDPQTIDVNIHPQKSEIKIEQKEKVQAAVTQAVRQSLEQHNLIPVVDVETEQQLTFGMPLQKTAPHKQVKYSFTPSQQMELQVHDMTVQNVPPADLSYSLPSPHSPHFPYSPYSPYSSPAEIASKPMAVAVSSQAGLPSLRLLGQIHKTFFVAETEGGVLFIDQHAAHERVMYEKFMMQYYEKNVETQSLLSPKIVELTSVEQALLQDHAVVLSAMGFTLEHFESNSYRLSTVPEIFGRLQPENLLNECLHALAHGEKGVKGIQEMIITRMACWAAVMAGDVLTHSQFEEILAELRQTKIPFSCPHGRPTIIKMTADELEKKFRRK